MFETLPEKPDANALELAVLARWERERTFERLREQNRGGPTWSFIDGPVTANKKLAVHTAWGRTLKDVFQRYKALQGFDQRYQNGFDCQGLWIEVGVEHQLGFNSKREIERYGVMGFPMMLLFENGEPQAQAVGILPKSALERSLGLDGTEA